jgi:Sulfotransferase domain/N-terminal domain of galactosyltransferase
MQIVCVTTCKGRTQHLEQTLPANLADATGSNLKFVILDYNSPDHFQEFIQRNHQADIDSGRLTVYQFRGRGPFRMAHAKNMAHRLGMLNGADVLVNLDADNFTGAGFAEAVEDKMRDGNSFIWSRMIKDVTPRGITGRIAVNAGDFIKLGGYDERFSSWSPDDKDFNKRLRLHGLEAEEFDTANLKAVLHNDKMRFKEFSLEPGKERPPVDYQEHHPVEKVVVNGGRFGCGMVTKNFMEETVTLSPVPTRIFGIGLHKTATTSLHKALTILGYDSAHWKNAHWAKAIWDQMNQFGFSRTLEKSYALCDLPIPLLYESLDIAYPGSKFILTVRNEDDWLNSVSRHWSDANAFRNQWDADPFTHQVHTVLYGRRKFDAEIMLARYRRHNAEVRQYFTDRPSDLLVMNMDEYNWQGLPRFFGMSCPEKPYPMANVSQVVGYD